MVLLRAYTSRHGNLEKVDRLGNILLKTAVLAYYASTSDITRQGLLKCAANVAGAVGDAKHEGAVVSLTKAVVPSEEIMQNPCDVPSAT